jgi:hypothetical protein
MRASEINGLLNEGFIVKMKAHRGIFQIKHVKPYKTVVLIELMNGTKILMSKKRFSKSEFIIKDTNYEDQPNYDLNEILEILRESKQIVYRGKIVTDVQVVENRILIKTKNGTEYTLTPHYLLNYNIIMK